MDYTHNWLKQNPENFPVASWLLPSDARADVITFYGFARGADEIADSTLLSAEERRRKLTALETALGNPAEGELPEFAEPFAELVQERPPLLSFARDLLSAFVQDTIKSRYHDYNDLLNYCQRSAAPVGRALLYMCGQKDANLVAADALCNALQILNHIQDCSDDYVNLDRVYLPLDWFVFAGADVKMLASSDTTPQLRLVLDRALDNCETLLKKAQPLPATIKSLRMRIEVRWIYMCALALCAKLRTHDPLQTHVRIGPMATLTSLLKALFSL